MLSFHPKQKVYLITTILNSSLIQAIILIYWFGDARYYAALSEEVGTKDTPSAITHPSKFQIDPNKGLKTELFHGFYSIR